MACSGFHTAYYENGKQWSGAGVVIVENYYTKNGKKIPCILVAKDINRDKFIDFGGRYEYGHDNLQTTAHHELREESCNLFNISPQVLQLMPYSDSKYQSHYYRTYFIKINGVSRKMYYNNLRTLRKNNAPNCWLETNSIAHVPFENIPLEQLMYDQDIVTTDIDGTQVVLHNRLRQCLFHGYGSALDALNGKIVINSRNDGKIVKTHDFKNLTFSISK